MELRVPTVDDAPLIADLLNAHSLALFGETDLTAASVGDWFSIPDAWIRVAEEGEPRGYADMTEEAGRWSIDLRALDRRAAELLLAGAREEAGEGALLRGYAPAADEVAGAAYRAAGFVAVRHSFQMRIELEGPPEPPVLPAGISIRSLREGEEDRVHGAHMDAFRDHWDFHEQPYEQWRVWHRDREGFERELWFLAFDGDELAGIALTGPHLSGEPDFGWIDVLGVRPPWRRRGLGEALLVHSFRELRSRGFRRIGLGVDAENTTGAVRLYERAGMRAVRRSDTLELRT